MVVIDQETKREIQICLGFFVLLISAQIFFVSLPIPITLKITAVFLLLIIEAAIIICMLQKPRETW